ncbi:MAG: discoidin domain-containing protein, partial [Muribaculaceae bacterium]|nr:discoidin domain-containing protein [Muribaculaceae bacterium]
LVYVNGHPIGRIWEIGPQQTLYMPGCWLRKGENEIMVFDIVGPKEAKSEGLKTPMIDNLNIRKPVIHREDGENLDLSGERSILSASFEPGNGWQEFKFDAPAEGRWVCLEAVNSIDGEEVASIAELYLLDEDGNRISRESWTIFYADSEETKRSNHAADKIFDLQESTYWSTKKGDPFPHSVVIDLGSDKKISGIQYLPRMESEVPGAIKDFNVYVSDSPFRK